MYIYCFTKHYYEYIILDFGICCLGDTATNITAPPNKANPSPKPFTIADSVLRFNMFPLVCKKVNFSRSPVSAVTRAKPYVYRPRKTCQGKTLTLVDRTSPLCQKLRKPTSHCINFGRNHTLESSI